MEYGITAKPNTLGNTMSNAVLASIYEVLATQTYFEKSDPWTEILAAAAFAIFLTNNRKTGYSPGQLIFGRDMIIPIKYRVNWELIRQQKQTQINRNNTQENKHRVDYAYKVGDKVMLTKKHYIQI